MGASAQNQPRGSDCWSVLSGAAQPAREMAGIESVGHAPVPFFFHVLLPMEASLPARELHCGVMIGESYRIVAFGYQMDIYMGRMP